jgi:23S rRNA (uridine2552-2'-O)-methyltransferase
MTSARKSKKVNRAWLHDHLTDPYVKLAQKEGYRSRAAYKLKEIDETFGLIRPGQVVVDLGAAPGAWSQYLRRRFALRADAAAARAPTVADRRGAGTPTRDIAGSPAGTIEDGSRASAGGIHGTIIALDVLPMEPVDGVDFIQGDFRDEAVMAQLQARVGDRPVDVVVSDMAPNLSGIEVSDAARMDHLIELALDFAAQHLKPGGALVAKVFHGSGYSQLVERFKQVFRVVKPVKPKASRDKSAETFLVGIDLKRPGGAADGRNPRS